MKNITRKVVGDAKLHTERLTDAVKAALAKPEMLTGGVKWTDDGKPVEIIFEVDESEDDAAIETAIRDHLKTEVKTDFDESAEKPSPSIYDRLQALEEKVGQIMESRGGGR